MSYDSICWHMDHVVVALPAVPFAILCELNDNLVGRQPNKCLQTVGFIGGAVCRVLLLATGLPYTVYTLAKAILFKVILVPVLSLNQGGYIRWVVDEQLQLVCDTFKHIFYQRNVPVRYTPPPPGAAPIPAEPLQGIRPDFLRIEAWINTLSAKVREKIPLDPVCDLAMIEKIKQAVEKFPVNYAIKEVIGDGSEFKAIVKMLEKIKEPISKKLPLANAEMELLQSVVAKIKKRLPKDESNIDFEAFGEGRFQEAAADRAEDADFRYPKTVQYIIEVMKAVKAGNYGGKLQEELEGFLPSIIQRSSVLTLLVFHICLTDNLSCEIFDVKRMFELSGLLKQKKKEEIEKILEQIIIDPDESLSEEVKKCKVKILEIFKDAKLTEAQMSAILADKVYPAIQ